MMGLRRRAGTLDGTEFQIQALDVYVFRGAPRACPFDGARNTGVDVVI